MFFVLYFVKVLVAFLNSPSHTQTHQHIYTYKKILHHIVPQFSWGALVKSLAPGSLAYWDQLQRKRMKQIAQNGTSFPAMLVGSSQLVSVNVFLCRTSGHLPLYRSHGRHFQFPQGFAEASMAIITP